MNRGQRNENHSKTLQIHTPILFSWVEDGLCCASFLPLECVELFTDSSLWSGTTPLSLWPLQVEYFSYYLTLRWVPLLVPCLKFGNRHLKLLKFLWAYSKVSKRVKDRKRVKKI